MSQVVTGEAVSVDLRIARLPSRAVAASIDFALQAAMLLGVVLVGGRAGLSVDPSVALTLLLLTIGAVFLGYPVVFETLWHGRTPGKAAMGLRVVRDDGGPIRFRHALLRGLLGLFVERYVFVFVAVVTSLLSEKGKRLGDYAAGTLVLQERVPSRAPTLVAMPPGLAPWAATLDLSALPNDLALAVREFLGRAASLRPAAREQLGRQLYDAVTRVVAPPPPPGTPGWAYLAAVLAERRRRDEQRLRASAEAWSGAPPAGTPAPWGREAAPGVPSPWRPSAPAVGDPPVVGPPPVDPGGPAPRPGPAPSPAGRPATPATGPDPGPFTVPS